MGSGLVATAMAGVLAFAPGVGAVDLSLPTDTVVYAEPGTLIELGRVPVDTDLAGPLCTWEASVTNQNSAHPGNDIIVRSGDSELVLSEVEATEGKVTTNSGSAYLVDEVVVTLRMGPDGVFSGGLDLTIRYDQCTTTTTAPAPTTVPETTVPETTVPETTVSEPTTAPETPTTAGDLAPLGPTVVTTTTTAPTTTTVDIAPAGPVLPVTGSDHSQRLLLSGLGLVGVGAAASLTTRRATR